MIGEIEPKDGENPRDELNNEKLKSNLYLPNFFLDFAGKPSEEKNTYLHLKLSTYV